MGDDNRLAQLEARVAMLLDEVAQLKARPGSASNDASTPVPDDSLTRRGLLRHLGGAAVAGAGLVAAGGALAPQTASANDPNDLTVGNNTLQDAGANATGLKSSNADQTLKVVNTADGTGALGLSQLGKGVHGIANTASKLNNVQVQPGVLGESDARHGVVGLSDSNNGVVGLSDSGTGVFGVAHASSGNGRTAAVNGESDTEYGVAGTSLDNTGVIGVAKSDEAVSGGPAGVLGLSDDRSGVEGVSGTNDGVRGISNSGVGLHGTGGRAPLLLDPGPTTGPPSTGVHARGEVYVDSVGDLFICTAGDGTGIGTWQKVAYGTAAGPAVGVFTPVDPVRICDTRVGHGPGGVEDNPYNVYANGPIAAFGDLTIEVSGPIGPAGHQTQFVPVAATAVVFNLAVTAWQHAGNATCYPANLASVPTAANVNWPEPPTELAALSNLATVKLGAITGDATHTGIKVHNASGGSTEVIIDLAGYYS
jgi:hypothetical protein